MGVVPQGEPEAGAHRAGQTPPKAAMERLV